MKRAQLIHELKLIACGAAGAYMAWPSVMSQPVRGRMFNAIQDTYFSDCSHEWLRGTNVGNPDHWSTFETLADAILAEQQRLESAAKQGT